MKKLRSFALSFIIIIALIFCINLYCKNSISNNFSINLIKSYGNDVKNGSTFIQKTAAKNKNILMLYGSSELGTTNIPYNPINYFPKQEDKFVVSPIGKGYMQELEHAMKFACNPDLKGKKVGFIISMQWFLYKDGIPNDDFQMNFSELQFYETMKNPNLSEDVKKEIAKRVYSLTANNSFYSDLSIYTKLYTSNSFSRKIEFALLKPYFAIKRNLLSFSSNIKSYKLSRTTKGNTNLNMNNLSAIDEKQSFADAESLGKKLANNNEFYINNDYYNTYIKSNLGKIKNQYKNVKLTDSKEYDDLNILLKVCKAQGIKPLFILMPVNAKYYDFNGISESTRQAYFDKTKALISNYGFDVVDFQKHEYEKYLMQDGMHLGWKGWLYVDKEIDKYYHK